VSVGKIIRTLIHVGKYRILNKLRAEHKYL